MPRQWIRNALIVNGDGQTKAYSGDVLLDRDRIVAIGSVPHSQQKTADVTIDVGGLVLAPGFVDTHNHGALGGSLPGPSGIPLACELALRAGITKRLCGVDGFSPAPVLPEQRDEYAQQLRPLDGSIGEPWTWSSVSQFYQWTAGRTITDLGLYLRSRERKDPQAALSRSSADSPARAEGWPADSPAERGLCLH